MSDKFSNISYNTKYYVNLIVLVIYEDAKFTHKHILYLFDML